MAIVEFGNISADMRLTENDYGISALQNFDAFLLNFVPVRQEVLVNTPTSSVVRFYDASNAFITVSIQGNLTFGQITTASVEAAGVIETNSGNFFVDAFGNISGTATEVRTNFAQDGSLITKISGISVPVFPDPPSDESLLSGQDTVTASGGDDYLLGYAGNDSISGGLGNDTLDGGTGNDTLVGGMGDDAYLVDSASDIVTENAGAGTDSVTSSVSFSLSAEVENLTLTGTAITGTGNALNNTIIGNASSNSLFGGAGNDILDGGGGIDEMQGGSGDDTYIVSDIVTVPPTYLSLSNWGGGLNYMFTPASGTFTLSASDYGLDGDTLVDTVTLNYMEANLGGHFFSVYVSTRMLNTPLAPGTFSDAMRYPFETSGHPGLWVAGDGSGANTSTGSFTVVAGDFTYGAGDPQISQFAVNFTYSGDGGPTVTGTLSVNGPSGPMPDTVVELAGEGNDTVQSSVSYVLPANVEYLVLTGTGNIAGGGNELNNLLFGNAGVNALSGGAGDDAYIIQNAGDIVVENADEGTDTILSEVTYVLPANVEHLTLTGSANINGTGNSLNNTLVGDSGLNTLAGGDGNDTYVVQNTGDTIVENPGQGADIVTAEVSYALPANVEHIFLLGGSNLNATGNSLQNVIVGNLGTNILTGGLGDDIYFVQAPNASVVENAGEGRDTIFSFLTMTLPANVEDLYLQGAGELFGTGNALDNVITGTNAFNILDGGTGADTLIGGRATTRISSIRRAMRSSKARVKAPTPY